jgi:hypothetical protein
VLEDKLFPARHAPEQQNPKFVANYTAWLAASGFRLHAKAEFSA